MHSTVTEPQYPTFVGMEPVDPFAPPRTMTRVSRWCESTDDPASPALGGDTRPRSVGLSMDATRWTLAYYAPIDRHVARSRGRPSGAIIPYQARTVVGIRRYRTHSSASNSGSTCRTVLSHVSLPDSIDPRPGYRTQRSSLFKESICIRV